MVAIAGTACLWFLNISSLAIHPHRMLRQSSPPSLESVLNRASWRDRRPTGTASADAAKAMILGNRIQPDCGFQFLDLND